MINYYTEEGELLFEKPDLSKGYLLEREVNYIAGSKEINHMETIKLPSGRKLNYKVIDKPYEPEKKEVLSYTYYLYDDHPTMEMRLGALENAVTEIASEVYGT